MARAITQAINFRIRANSYILRKNLKCELNIQRQLNSALFIPGSKASETFSYFSPYLDFDTKFTTKTQEELVNRGLNVDLIEMKKTWQLYKSLSAKRETLEQNQQRLKQQIAKLLKLEEHDNEQQQELNALELQSKIIKKDVEMIRGVIWEMEEDIVVRGLRLPNELHEKTPVECCRVVESVGELSDVIGDKRSHIEIGTTLNLLEYRNSTQYFLFNEAAYFEQGLLNLFRDVLGKSGMIPVIGLDFSRSSIVEGSGLDHEDPNSAFLLKNNNDNKNLINPLHLVGTASLVSFLGLNTKRQFNPKDLPANYFSAGRQYTPRLDCNESEGLFNVCQESVVPIFGVSQDQDRCEKAFEKIMVVAKQLYGKLCSHYRIVMRSAKELKPWESLRVSFEVWSAYGERYVEVGHVAMHSDYFSKRLLIVYQTPTGRDFPCILSGTLVSVPKLLGCLLEVNSQKFVMPPEVAQNMYWSNL